MGGAHAGTHQDAGPGSPEMAAENTSDLRFWMVTGREYNVSLVSLNGVVWQVLNSQASPGVGSSFYRPLKVAGVLAQSHGMEGRSSWGQLPSPVSPGRSCRTPSLASQLSPEVAHSSAAPSTTSRTKAQRLKERSHRLRAEMGPRC